MTVVYRENIEADPLTERLGQIIDTASNYLTYRHAPMPPALKVSAYHQALVDVRNAVQQLYFDLGGEDVWDCRASRHLAQPRKEMD